MKRTNIDEMICKQEGIAEVTREALNKIQLAKLNAVLKREKEREGFYRNLPEKLENLDALKTFPFTTESELAKNSGRMLLCSQGEVQRVISEQTSGTTGAGKRVFYTERDCEHTIELFMAGLGEFIYPGSTTMVAMPFSGPFGLGELIAEAIRRIGAKPLLTGTGRTYGELKTILEKDQPDSLTFLGKVGVGISEEKLENGQLDAYDRVFLVLDDEENYQGEVEQLPDTLSVSIRFCGGHQEAEKYYRKLLSYIKEHQLKIAGFSREITLIDYGITNDTGKFVTEILIPVCEN